MRRSIRTEPSVIDWPSSSPDGAGAADQPADLGHRGADRGQGAAAHAAYAASLADADWREAHRAERLGGGTAQGGACPISCRPTASRWRPSRCMASRAIPEWAYLVTGFQRVHRQFLRVRPVRTGEAVRLLSAGTGRHVRAGDPGGGAAHPAVRQLAGLASAASAVVASGLVRAAGRRGLGVPRLGAHRHRARHGRRRAANQRTTTSR